MFTVVIVYLTNYQIRVLKQVPLSVKKQLRKLVKTHLNDKVESKIEFLTNLVFTLKHVYLIKKKVETSLMNIIECTLYSLIVILFKAFCLHLAVLIIKVYQSLISNPRGISFRIFPIRYMYYLEFMYMQVVWTYVCTQA